MSSVRKLPTIKEVAAEAGVSMMTVSAVLGRGTSHNSRVSEATKERVLEAARRINYFPSAFAQGMRRRRINAIGVLLFHPHARLTGDSNVCGLLDGIFAVANEHRQNTTVFTGQRWSNASESLPVFCDGRTDGLVILWPPEESDIISALLRVEIPFVLVNGYSDDPRVWQVCVDDVAAMQALIEQVIEHGHRKIAYLSGPPEGRSARDRLEGWRRALIAAGIECDLSRFVSGAYSAVSGYERARAILEMPLSERPTAVCCGSDQIAQGVLQAFQEANVRVPEQISVTGFDDIAESANMTPPLTTVHQSFEGLGRRGAEMLLAAVAGDTPEVKKEFLPTRVVARRSVAPPAAC